MVKIIILTATIFIMSIRPIYTSCEFIPSQTELLGVQLNDGELVVNVSKDITSYGGGNAMEYAVLGELLEKAFFYPSVDSFTLLIEGEEAFLPEGTQILDYSRERYEEGILNGDNYFCHKKQR